MHKEKTVSDALEPNKEMKRRARGWARLHRKERKSERRGSIARKGRKGERRGSIAECREEKRGSRAQADAK